MHRITSKLFILAALAVLSSCYYDSEEDLYPELGCSTDDMSYVNDILPIIDQNCMVCHSASANFGGVTLEGYDALKIWVDNGRFLGSIRRDPGFSPMPQGQPQILQCNIEKIESWINDGAPNN